MAVGKAELRRQVLAPERQLGLNATDGKKSEAGPMNRQNDCALYAERDATGIEMLSIHNYPPCHNDQGNEGKE